MKIGILGLGLIGGSLARAYALEGHTVYACEKDEQMLSFAMLAGAVHEELTESTVVGDAMVAVPLTKGYHELAFIYHNRAFAIGWKVSFVSAAILLGLYFWIYPARKKKGKYAK